MLFGSCQFNDWSNGTKTIIYVFINSYLTYRLKLNDYREGTLIYAILAHF